MPLIFWIAVTAVLFVAVHVFAFALCRIAARADERIVQMLRRE